MSKRINIHTHQKSTNEEAIEVMSLFHNASLPEEGLFSIGVHPWHSEKCAIQSLIDEVFPKARFAFAIGECGLDRSSSTNWDKQIELFRKQIELSENAGKPLIIHCVRAYPEIIALHKIYRPSQSWIIHGFQGDTQTVELLIKHKISISYGAYILRDNPKIIESLKSTPLDYLFLETDESSIRIGKIYEYTANLLNISEEKLTEQIYSNFERIQK